jgi:hypothetical protein
MLSARELAYVVHPRLNSLDTETVEDCGLGYEHPALVRQLAAAPGATGHAVAEWSAVQALRQVGLLDDDAVQTVIGQFGGGSVAQVTSQFMQRAAQLGRDRDRTRARLAAVQNGDPHAPYWVEELEFHWANQRIWAIQATRYACVEDGVSAALGAVDTGMRCFGCVGADSAFAAQAGQLIGTPLAEWPEQPTALPAPLTAEQRAEQLDWAAWRPRYGDDVRVPALEPWQRGHQRLRELIRDFSLGGLEPDMIDLERLPVMTRRAIAVWAAHRALEQAGLDRLSWITPALAALDDGRSLPPPFDDPADAWARLAADAEAPSSYVTAFDGETQDHQQSMALPVLAVAALADATQAATNALWYAAATAGIDYNTQVVQPLHQVFDL